MKKITKKILITGFEPFGGETQNPSQLLVQDLTGTMADVETLILPVDFERAFNTLKEKVSDFSDYQCIIMLGQAKGRSSVCLERVALNWTQSPGTSEREAAPEMCKIFADAPDAYIVDFFPEAWAQELSKVGPTAVSHSAGTYVCNNLYFKTVHSLQGRLTSALFVHLPLIPQQVPGGANTPSMQFEMQKNIVMKLLNFVRGIS